jgi:hypothetical protein
LGGSPTSNGLIDGFAVLSSDAGHVPDATYANDPATGMGISGQVFGLDPQARVTVHPPKNLTGSQSGGVRRDDEGGCAQARGWAGGYHRSSSGRRCG